MQSACVHFATYALYNTYMYFATCAFTGFNVHIADQLDRPVGRTSLTDKQDRPAGQTSFRYLKSCSVRLIKDGPFSLYIVAASESDEGLG